MSFRALRLRSGQAPRGITRVQLHIRIIIGIPRRKTPQNDMMAEREFISIREGLQRRFGCRYSNRLSLLNTVTGMPFCDAHAQSEI
jgi:hypothetical protein